MMKRSMRRELLLDMGLMFERYLDRNIHIEDHADMWEKILKDPFLGLLLLENSRTSNTKKQKFLIKKITEQSTIAYIVGKRGSGKTTIAAWICEEAKKISDRPIVWLQTMMPLPHTWLQVENIDDAPTNSIFVIDEASITLNARRSMSKDNLEMSQKLAISRHQGLSIIFISQHTALADRNILRMSDVFIFKKLTWDQLYSRDDKTIDKLLEYASYMQAKTPEEALISDGETWYNMKTPLPSFWTERHSKSFNIIDEIDAIDFVLKMTEGGATPKQIQKQLKVRGISWDIEEIRNAQNAPKTMKKNIMKLIRQRKKTI